MPQYEIKTNEHPINKDEFILSPLHSFLMKDGIKNPIASIDRAMNINLTGIINLDINFRLTHNKNIIIALFGETGSFKSGCAISLALQITQSASKVFGVHVPFYLNQITSDDGQLLDLILGDYKNAPKGTTFIKDETDEQLAGYGSIVNRQAMKDLYKRIRKKIYNFILIAPNLLSQNLTVAHYILETKGNYYLSIDKLEKNDDFEFKEHKYIVENNFPEKKKILLKIDNNPRVKEFDYKFFDELNSFVKYTRLLLYDSNLLPRGIIYLESPPEKILNDYNTTIKEQILEETLELGRNTNYGTSKALKLIQDNVEVEFFGKIVKAGDFWFKIRDKSLEFKMKFVKALVPRLISKSDLKDAVKSIQDFLTS